MRIHLCKLLESGFECLHSESRPGILVIINDTDWELLDELQYKLQHKDNIVFISTLHGG